MNKTALCLIAAILLLPLSADADLFNRNSEDERRTEIHEVRDEVLARLYEE